jgi:hypothetical protein
LQHIAPNPIFGNLAKADEEEYPGEIDQDTTWDSGHETIDYEVIIFEDATLTVEQGTHDFQSSVDLYPGAKLILKGGEYSFEKGIFANGATITFEKGNYTFEGDFVLNDNAKLVIKEGVNIKFKKTGGSTPNIQLTQSTITAQGTKDEMITFQGADENSKDYNIFIEGYGDEVSKLNYVNFIGGGDIWDYDPQASLMNFLIKTAHAEEEFDGRGTLEISNGSVSIENSKFENNNYYAISYETYIDTNDDYLRKNLTVANSDFGENPHKLAVISKMQCAEGTPYCSNRVTLENDWYDSESGPKAQSNPDGTGNKVTGLVNLDGWNTQSNFSQVVSEGPSNVLFLPGLEGSRLYRNGLINWDNLWPPTLGSNDISQLFMDQNGRSIENVFTNDIIESIGGDVYKTFADKLRTLKNDGTINDFNLFAYDWRQGVEDIAQNGTPYAGMVMRSATIQAKALAITSKSKKVTIVAHSNGGLLAKAIMLELKKEGKEDMVDKIIFVASPQMGTPKAITSMLYGYDEGLLHGLLGTESKMRTFAENMPGAYGLLPSKTYLERIEDPIIKFSSDHTRYKTFKDVYGDDIIRNEYDQFFGFLAGDDGREEPDDDDTKLENVLDGDLLRKAKEAHERLDAWVPPSNVQVVQIAGWGLDTISGIEYREKKGTACVSYSSKVPSCMETDTYYEPYYDPMRTVDGDEVVVAPSALMLPGVDNVKKYWVDLYRYNEAFKEEKEHGNILEVNAVNDLILHLIINNSVGSLPNQISTSRPNDYAGAKPRLRMSLYSPLDIHLYSNNKHTGPKTIEENGQQYTIIEEEIPNSYYYQFDDRKYLGIPVGENIQVEMDGYDNGSYTFKIEEVKVTENGEETTTQTTFANLPVSSSTKVTLDIPEAGLENIPNLKADYDGDGSIDYEATINPNGETQIVDNIKPTIEIINPEEKEYPNNQMINLTYEVTDNLSEREDMSIQTKLDNQEIIESKIDLSMLNLGNHTIKITATDKANNTQEKEIAFSTTTNIQAIQDNIKKYYEKRLIKSKQQKNMLLVSLGVIEQRLEFLEMIRKNPYISKKAKSIIEKIVREQIENHIDFLIRQINHNSNKYDVKIRGLLIEDLQWLEANAVK